jgi:hypothetical protein
MPLRRGPSSAFGRLAASVIAASLVILPAPALAQGVERARQAFGELSAAAEQALERALETAAPDARPELERALGTIRESRQRVMTELTSAGEAPGAAGHARALEAVDRGTQTHQRVLQAVLGKVPDQARPAIERALEVSRTGRDTALRALEGTASAGPPPAGGHGAPPGIHPGQPTGMAPGPPGGVRGGRPSGVRGR